jgi:hypothetical protein
MRAGAGIEVASGAGFVVQDELFTGRWTDTDARLVLHGRRELGGGFDVGFGFGAGIRMVVLSGSILAQRKRTRTVRINPTALGWGELGYWVGQDIRLGLRWGATHSFRTQAYLVHGDAVLDLKPVTLDAALVAEIVL